MRLMAGAGRTDITPGDEFTGRLELAGYGDFGERYGKRRFMEGVHDRLYSTALVLEDDEKKIALASADLLGLPEELSLKAKDRVRKYLDIPAENIIIACTHTHHGPATSDTRACGDPNPEYLERLPEIIADSIIDAHLSRKPVHDLRAARGELGRPLSFNRERDKRNYEADHEVYALFAESGLFSNIFTLWNFGCHPVVLERDNTLITRDFPGAVADLLERSGYNRVIFTNGVFGDVDPVINMERKRPGKPPAPFRSDFKDLGIYAAALGKKVMDLDSESASFPHDIRMVSRKVRLPVNAKYPLEESDFDPVREAPGSPFRLDYVQALERFMDSVRQGKSELPKYYEGDLHAIKIGRDVLLGMHTELMSETGLEIKRRHPGAVIIGNAGTGVWGYVPTNKAARDLGYIRHGSKLQHLFPFSPEAEAELLLNVDSIMMDVNKPHKQPI